MGGPIPDATVTGEQGGITLQNPAPGVVVSEAFGHATLPIGAKIVEFVSLAMVQHPDGALIFHDWRRVEGYDTEVRRMLVEAGKRDRAHTRAINILVRSKVLAMGLSVAGLALGALTAYRDSFAFTRALDAAIESRGSFEHETS